MKLVARSMAVAILTLSLLAAPRSAPAMHKVVKDPLLVATVVVLSGVLLGGTAYFIYGSIHPEVSGFGSDEATREGYMRGAGAFLSVDVEGVCAMVRQARRDRFSLIDIKSQHAEFAFIAPGLVPKGLGFSADIISARF